MFLTVHFETLTYRLNLLRTLLESTGLLRLKSDSLINFLLTKSIQHEGKVLRIHKMINKENALIFYQILSIKFFCGYWGLRDTIM